MKKLLILIFILSGFFIACKKESKVENPWMAKITTNKYANFGDIFKEINHASLNLAIKEKKEFQIRSIVNDIANDIASLFFHKYKIDLRNDFLNDPEGIVTLGLFYAAKEKKSNIANFQSESISTFNYQDDFDCFVTAISTAIGIADAKNIWKAITAGATEQTVIAVVRAAARRVVGIVTVGILIYEAGRCLDYW